MPSPALAPLLRMVELARTPRLRTMREFAEQEIILPTGPFKGLRYATVRNPYGALWFAECDKPWRRLVATGPRQSGKTLNCHVIPILYHLFEVKEEVILAAPNADLVNDKWYRDILPVVEASRYKDLLPRKGQGSKGGDVTLVQFAHGPVLRCMTGGGGDKSRAGFTSRIVCVTETDGMDESSENSREADKITQIEACTQAFGDRARVYLECTVSVESGRTWQEFTKGSHSRIAIRCPHCKRHVTPEREHLQGWQNAEDEIQAGEHTRFACPDCGAEWSEEDRAAANRDALLVHKGQEVTPDGTLTGGPPRTNTLGFRWTAANNLLVKSGVVGQMEWKAARSPDEDNSEKSMRQFVWALPHVPAETDLTALDPHGITKRQTADPRGRVPTDCGKVTVGIDLGKRFCAWVAVAWRGDGPHVIEYGRLEVLSDQMGDEQALLMALRDFRDDVLKKGWPADTGSRVPALTFVDAGWLQHVAAGFCKESGTGFVPTKGISSTQHSGRRLAREAGSKVLAVGEAMELVRLVDGTRLMEVNGDYWKSWLHSRLRTPKDQPGAMTLHQGTDHLSLAKHLTAEKQVEEFVAGRGLVTRWEMIHRNNHFLDAGYLACAAGSAERAMNGSVRKPTEKTEQSIAPGDWLGGGKRW